MKTWGWQQVFGLGIRFRRKTQRLTVRPGPKRIGYGLHPQTWQGWAIVLAAAAAVVVIMVILRH